MGNWKLEVAKMAMYISFPVGMFHIFNQPELFEEWVVKTKREMYPHENDPDIVNMKAQLKLLKEKQQREHLESLEQNL